MALEREALSHKIEDDLALRNRNWDELDSHLADYETHLADYESLIKGGETYEAVLQNGWTGSLQYSKNDLGLVWLRGYITPGELTENTTIATIPADYAPLSYSVSIPLFRSGRPRRGVVGLFLSSTSNNIITLSEMAETFSEGQALYIHILYQSVGKEV